MGSRGFRLLGLTAVLAAALAGAPAAEATITFGSNLAPVPTEETTCGPESTCTRAQSFLPSGSHAAVGYVPPLTGTVESPVNGIVTRWRIRAGALTGLTAFRIVRPIFAGPQVGFHMGAGTSAPVTPQPNAVTTTTTALPISIRDQIGLDFPDTPVNYSFASGGIAQGVGSALRWDPVLADGEVRFNSSSSARTLTLNADVEPTSSIGFPKAKSKKGGKVSLSVELPNPGVLVAGDARDAGIKAVAAKKRKLLKRTSAEAKGPGELTITVKPTKVAKSILADGSRPKAKLKLVFTPLGGSASTRVVKVKLKP